MDKIFTTYELNKILNDVKVDNYNINTISNRFSELYKFLSNKKLTDNEIKIRINSDPFPLPTGRTGFYGCSKLRLTLISTRNKQLTSGDLISVKKPKEGKIDKKSGAQIVEL